MTIEGATPREAGIDLLRALSVALVVFSHYGLLPVGFLLEGFHGVVVFFAVSGYCMAMTAPHKAFWSFWRARWIRLVPALIICALITSIVEAAFPSDRGQTPRDLLMTLACIPTFDVPCELGNAWAVSRGSGMNYLFVDGAYWSLLVEFRFYLVFAVVFFIGGQVWRPLRRFSWLAMLTAGLLAFWPPEFGQGRARDFAQYLPFFAFGLAAYERQKGDRWAWLGLILSLAMLAAYSWVDIARVGVPFGWDSFQKYAILLSFALLALQWNARHSMATSAIRLIAAISYPLYLIHLDVGLTLIRLLLPITGELAAQLITLGCAVAIASAVHWWVEIPAINLAKRWSPLRRPVVEREA